MKKKYKYWKEHLPGGGGILGGPPWGIGCCCNGGGGRAAGGSSFGSISSHSEDKSPELNLKKMKISISVYV